MTEASKKPTDLIHAGEQLPPRILALLDEATTSVEQNRHAENTKKAYSSDWSVFQDWCAQNNVEAMPASPAVLIAFFTDMKTMRAPATLSRYLVSIRAAHEAFGHPTPTTHPAFTATWKSLRREIGTRQRGKAALPKEALLACMEQQDVKTLTGMRNRAMLLVGFMGGYRRSELCNLRVDDLEWEDQGVIIHLRRSKTDQEGEGSAKAFPYKKDKTLCVPSTIRQWMDAARIKSGWLWRTKHGGRWQDKPITEHAFAKMFKASLASAGIDKRKYGAHSLRSGIATHMAERGVEERQIQGHLGHSTTKMTRRYIKQGNLWKNNPLNDIE